MKRLHGLYVTAGIAAVGLSAFAYQAFGQLTAPASLVPPSSVINDEQTTSGSLSPQITNIPQTAPAGKESSTELSQRASQLAQEFAKATTDEQGAAIKAKLTETLDKIFGLQQDRRAAQIAELKKQVADLEEVSATREAARASIVGRRLQVLTGGKDTLAWEDDDAITSENAKRAYYSAPVYGPPGSAPGFSPLPPDRRYPPGVAPGFSPSLPQEQLPR